MKTIEDFCGSPIWDSDVIFNATLPVLPECFRSVILTPVCCLLTILLCIIQLLRLPKYRIKLRITRLFVMKMLVLTIICLISLSTLVLDIVRMIHNLNIVQSGVLFPAVIYFTVLVYQGQRKSLISSGCLFLSAFFLWLAVISDAIPAGLALSGDLTLQENWESTRASLVVLQSILLTLNFILQCFAESDFAEDGTTVCPEYNSSFLNQLTFAWFTKMAYHGWRRPVEENELWELNPRDTSASLVQKWDRAWTREVARYWSSPSFSKLESNQNGKTVEHVGLLTGKKRKQTKPSLPSITKTFVSVFKWFLLPGTSLKVCADLMRFAMPVILGKLIGEVKDTESNPWRGALLAIAMFVISSVYTVLLQRYFHTMYSLGMNLKSALTASVYAKALRLSPESRQGSTVGEIVNLMSVDVQRLMDLIPYINMFWSCPLQIVVSLILLWNILGPAVLSGMAVLCLLIPVNALVASRLKKFQVTQMARKDERVNLMTEILNGMKILKLYAWEEPFEKRVFDIRKKEVTAVRFSAYLNAGMSFMWLTVPFLVSAASFTTFVLMDKSNVLTPQVAFVSLALFDVLKMPMAVLPMLITLLVQSKVSIKRLTKYLMQPELLKQEKDHDLPKGSIKIKDASLSWAKSEEEFEPTLSKIELEVQSGELVAIVGAVGSGKSSLLQAIMQEMYLLSGDVKSKGKIAYVPQSAWIQNLTVRDNILFGAAYEKSRYSDVLKDCALEDDLKILTDGDNTEIGEKGVNLSGGQKQRVSIARAVYPQADIVLMDDPLSAVDVHVGDHIFDNVIKGALKKKTRLLVTHRLKNLKDADQIVVMSDGRIEEIGTYDELMKLRGVFKSLMDTHDKDMKKGQNAPVERKTSSDSLRRILLSPRLQKRRPTGSHFDLRDFASVLNQKHGSRLSLRHAHDDDDDDADHENDVTHRHMQHKHQKHGNHASRFLMNVIPTSLHTGFPHSEEMSNVLADSVSKLELWNDEHISDSTLSLYSERGDAAHHGSNRKLAEDPQAAAAVKGKIIEEEGVEEGRVSLSVITSYLASVGAFACLLVVFTYIASTAFYVGSNVWLSRWSDDSLVLNATEIDVPFKIGIYFCLGLVQGVAIFCGSLLLAHFMVSASAKLHVRLVRNLMRVPLGFFDVTPIGRIINRCSKDCDTLDDKLQYILRSWFESIVIIFAILIIITASTPTFLGAIAPLAVIYAILQRFYVCTSRQLKRLESKTRSPIYSHFQETVQGAVVIRATGSMDRFCLESQRRVDLNNASYYAYICSNRWLGFNLEMIGSFIVLFAAVFAVIARGDISPGTAGLSIAYALTITPELSWCVRMLSEVESNIVSVERIQEYVEVKQEAEWESSDPPKDAWPEDGAVELSNYQLKYRPDLPPALRDVNFVVEPKEKVGIVGRTGAGKSSLSLALFRIVEPADGTIRIDNVDVCKIGLHELRSKITIIPQDPILFTGTLRENIDPFGVASDSEIWDCLRAAHMGDALEGLIHGLDEKISEGGENFSLGQRQLICLARALLRKTRILVMDEATAAIDVETDALIQQTIREQFRDCTVLTIAHRINTVLDSDRIMAFSEGQLVEFDTPLNLMKNKESLFSQMMQQSKQH